MPSLCSCLKELLSSGFLSIGQTTGGCFAFSAKFVEFIENFQLLVFFELSSAVRKSACGSDFGCLGFLESIAALSSSEQGADDAAVHVGQAIVSPLEAES